MDQSERSSEASPSIAPRQPVPLVSSGPSRERAILEDPSAPLFRIVRAALQALIRRRRKRETALLDAAFASPAEFEAWLVDWYLRWQENFPFEPHGNDLLAALKRERRVGISSLTLAAYCHRHFDTGPLEILMLARRDAKVSGWPMRPFGRRAAA
jgi:hypothetical protein